MRGTCTDIFTKTDYQKGARGRPGPLDVHELARLSGRISPQELGGGTAEHVSEAGQKKSRVQDESVGTTGGHFRRNK